MKIGSEGPYRYGIRMEVVPGDPNPEAHEERPCAYQCGLVAEPGDRYCEGCRSGFDQQMSTT